MELAAQSKKHEPLIPNGVMAMLVFVAAEIMFFLALISAFSIVKSSAIEWPPSNLPRLPIVETAINTFILLLSGVLLFVSHKSYQKNQQKGKKLLWASIALGAVFVIFQGVEWTGLLSYGLTIKSGNYGGFFYLIIGAHAAHAIIALLGMIWVAIRSISKDIERNSFFTIQVFWYFVVGLWPLLYLCVYF